MSREILKFMKKIADLLKEEVQSGDIARSDGMIHGTPYINVTHTTFTNSGMLGKKKKLHWSKHLGDDMNDVEKIRNFARRYRKPFYIKSSDTGEFSHAQRPF